jgi:hypothetical protein
MIYNWWDREKVAFHDKAYKRGMLPDWDARWHRLSAAARRHFLRDVKGVGRTRVDHPPETPAERFPVEVLEELTGAGLVKVAESRGRSKVAVAREAVDFHNRLRALERYRLLSDGGGEELARYAGHCFASYELSQALYKVLHAAGIGTHALFGDVYHLYVTRRRWPGWVARYLKDPLARPVLGAVEKAGGKLPLAELPGRVPGHDPKAVRAALEKLVTHLALFEDLDTDSLEIVVGFLPSVWEDMSRAGQPKARPALEPAPAPVEPGPAGGVDVPDLRAVLLELAAERARLRQDRTLFQKEEDRFRALLEPVPDWLADDWQLTPQTRLENARRWAYALGLVAEKKDEDRRWLELSPQGSRWLSAGLNGQYTQVYDYLRNTPPGAAYYHGDFLFLGSHTTAVLDEGRGRDLFYEADLPPRRRQPLREALYRAFAELPAGSFVPLKTFLAHAVHGADNPLLLGGEKEKVAVRVHGRLAPPLEEQLEEIGRQLLTDLIRHRLVPLGCLQAGRDPSGRLAVARLPRLEAYFGRDMEKADEPAVSEATRVVVQPDFTVVVIGLNPAPAADLAPFCDPLQGGAGQGSLTLRLTRDAVLRGVRGGLTAEEILGRLKRHSSTPVPGNVEQEVRDWCAWVRTVSASPATLVRCPDRATADRVQSALGKRAERLNDTTVAYPAGRLTAGERQKLLGQGVFLDEGGRKEPI